MKYTVLLLYPDYLAHNYGEDTYAEHVEAIDPQAAVEAAQSSASALFGDDNTDADDFTPLLVVAGHHDDLTPV